MPRAVFDRLNEERIKADMAPFAIPVMQLPTLKLLDPQTWLPGALIASSISSLLKIAS